MHNIAGMLDSTLLKATAASEEIEALCQEAVILGCAAVCVNTAYVPLVARLLVGTSVKVCTTVGFPLGQMSSAAKAFEAKQAVEDGAEELDMVVNLGMLRSGDWAGVEQDIQAVRQACAGKTLKVIFEICYLSNEEIVELCNVCVRQAVDFVKTSTGLATGGATVEAVRIMRETVGPKVGVKAAGGIRTRADAEMFVAAGANRIGTSAAAAIVRGQ